MAENTETTPSHDQPSTLQERVAGQEGSAVDTTAALHRAFDSYPWAKDQAFIAQLLEALRSFAPNGPSLSDLALQARVRRFEQQTKIHVDGDAYKQWLTRTNARPPRVVSEETVAEEAMAVQNPEERRLARLLVELGDELGNFALHYRHEEPGPPPAAVPSWQTAAPKADLYIQKKSSPTDPDKEPYPKKFEEIVEFLRTGKEIPGIRKIPDTVVEDPAITPQGRLKAPPKPWEIGKTPSGDAST